MGGCSFYAYIIQIEGKKQELSVCNDYSIFKEKEQPCYCKGVGLPSLDFGLFLLALLTFIFNNRK